MPWVFVKPIASYFIWQIFKKYLVIWEKSIQKGIWQGEMNLMKIITDIMRKIYKHVMFL